MDLYKDIVIFFNDNTDFILKNNNIYLNDIFNIIKIKNVLKLSELDKK